VAHGGDLDLRGHRRTRGRTAHLHLRGPDQMTITRSLSAPLRSALVAAVLLAGLVGFAVGPLATPAAGHEGAGIFEVEAAHPAGGTAVHYIVRLTWENDGHAATGATVTAAPVAS